MGQRGGEERATEQRAGGHVRARSGGVVGREKEPHIPSPSPDRNYPNDVGP